MGRGSKMAVVAPAVLLDRAAPALPRVVDQAEKEINDHQSGESARNELLSRDDEQTGNNGAAGHGQRDDANRAATTHQRIDRDRQGVCRNETRQHGYRGRSHEWNLLFTYWRQNGSWWDCRRLGERARRW